MHLSPIRKKYGEIILAATTGAHLINDLYMMILPPLLPALMLAFQLNYSLAGLLMSLILLISFIMSLSTGYIADTTNSRKIVLVAGFIFYGLSVLFLGLANNFVWLILACLIMGVAQATYHPQAVSFINFFVKRSKGIAFGIHGVGGGIGHFVAPILVGFLVLVIGWRTSLFVLFAPPILMAGILWWLLKEPSLPSSKGFVKTLTYPLLLLTLVSSLRDIVYRGLTSFLPSYFVVEGSDIFQAGILTALMLVSGIIAQPLGGSLSDRIGRKRTFIITLLLLLLSLIGFTFTKGASSLIFLLLIGIGVFATFPVTFIYASELVGSEKTGTSIGFYFGTSQVLTAASPLIMGYFIDNWGFTSSFYLLIIFTGMAFLGSLSMPEK